MNKNPKLYLKHSGMTLVELMVSLVILAIVLGAIYSILNFQQTRATQISRTTIMQTDAQVALTLVKWDLMMTGYGYPYSKTDAIQISSGGGAVMLKAVGLGFEMNRARWSYILQEPENQAILLVRKWADSLANFEDNDTLMILDESRTRVYDNVVVSSTDTMTFIDPVTGSKTPGLILNVSIPIQGRRGAMVIRRAGNVYYGGVTYYVANDTLYRGTEPLLTNCEAIQFRYGLDQNNDGVVSAGEWGNANNPPTNVDYYRKWAARFTMVVTSEGLPGYKYPDNNVTIEANPPYNYLLSIFQQRKKRSIMSALVFPQNLQPPEGM